MDKLEIQKSWKSRKAGIGQAGNPEKLEIQKSWKQSGQNIIVYGTVVDIFATKKLEIREV